VSRERLAAVAMPDGVPGESDAASVV